MMHRTIQTLRECLDSNVYIVPEHTSTKMIRKVNLSYTCIYRKGLGSVALKVQCLEKCDIYKSEHKAWENIYSNQSHSVSLACEINTAVGMVAIT